MATYLASFNEATSATASPETITASSEKAALSASLLEPVGARIFDGACAACHGSDSRIASLALNTNMHAATPTNVIGTIHQGILLPVGTRNETMAMPSFARLLYNDAIAALVRYIRARFAPDKAPWQGFERAIAQYTAKKSASNDEPSLRPAGATTIPESGRLGRGKRDLAGRNASCLHGRHGCLRTAS
jgi:nicotinate dehydrogenase subunit B